MHLSYRNACALVEDAEALLDTRPARALSLAVLAMEEAGKTMALYGGAILACKGPVSWHKLKRVLRFSSHQKKQELFAATDSVLAKRASEKVGKPPPRDPVPPGYVPLLDRMKQMGFYVDCFDGKFISPEDDPESRKEWATWLLAGVRERLAGMEPLMQSQEESQWLARSMAEWTDEVFTALKSGNGADIETIAAEHMRRIKERKSGAS